MDKIYFDNASTTQMDPEVLKSMRPYFNESYGNASSLHSLGQKSAEAVESAKARLADFLQCSPAEVYFTSGATESNNTVISGVINYYQKKFDRLHIITSQIEHPAVLEVVKNLESNKTVEVDYLSVNDSGVIDLKELKQKIKPYTVLVSVMWANNEVGSVQPIEKIGQLIEQEKSKRKSDQPPIYFHSDAVQAVNYLDLSVKKSEVDFLSLSGHKIYGPKGVGALYIRQGAKIKPLIFGGHQQDNIRPGTLNTPAIVGLAKAVELIEKNKSKDLPKIKTIKQKLVSGLEKIDQIKFNGDLKSQLPNIINISFFKAEGESILMMLDMEDIYVSTGSACSSGTLQPSHVLTAMGVSPEWSHGSIRISLGRFNSLEEVDIFLQKINPIIKKLRKMAP